MLLKKKFLRSILAKKKLIRRVDEKKIDSRKSAPPQMINGRPLIQLLKSNHSVCGKLSGPCASWNAM